MKFCAEPECDYYDNDHDAPYCYWHAKVHRGLTSADKKAKSPIIDDQEPSARLRREWGLTPGGV